MSTRTLVHKEDFANSPERLFTVLHKPSYIRRWWGAARTIVIPSRGGTLAAAWGNDEDDPDFISEATISEFEPPRRLVLIRYRYYAKSGPLPFDSEFSTEFDVGPGPSGAFLQVTQDGFPAGPEADGFYESCRKGWKDAFAGIRRLLDELREEE